MPQDSADDLGDIDLSVDLDAAPTVDDLTRTQIQELADHGIPQHYLTGEHTIRTLLNGVRQRTPSEVTVPGFHWIFVSTGDTAETNYYEQHGVQRTSEITEADLPPTNHDAVADLDREALDQRVFGGKWNVFRGPNRVDAVWSCVETLVQAREVWRAKVSTRWSADQRDQTDHVIVVYTPNYFDQDDVFRVRELLRDQCDVTDTIYYKPDLYTRKGIYSETAAEMGLPGASRYSG